YTRGLESELGVRPLKRVRLSAGYQFLEAKDRDVLEAISEGTLYRRENGRDRRVTAAEYGGLMNRSRHAANVRAEFTTASFSASIRGQYRSRYGFGDRNGNLVLDEEREYVPGYWLWHVTVTQELPYGVS